LLPPEPAFGQADHRVGIVGILDAIDQRAKAGRKDCLGIKIAVGHQVGGQAGQRYKAPGQNSI
jgi:hypothetical protein